MDNSFKYLKHGILHGSLFETHVKAFIIGTIDNLHVCNPP